MSDYTKATNFAAKDALASGDPNKIVKGTEIDNEYNAISTAIASKANSASPAFSGTASGSLKIPDNVLSIVDNADNTKGLQFEVSGVTAGNTRTATVPDYNVRVGNLPAGIIAPYAGATVPTGWLECDGSAVSRTTYAALFTALSTTWGAGDGSTTFNLPDLRNKTPIGAGTGTVAATVAAAAVDTTADTFTVASNNTKWITGMKVQLTTTGGLPGGLAAATDYWVIRASATTIKFAASLANAQNGTAIDLTTQGTGNHTLTHTYTARTLGEYGGEESHAMSSTELLAHTHTVGTNEVAGGSGEQGTGVTMNATSGSAGGNVAMNIMQPFGVVKYLVSY